jgi:proline dehydrogenase
MAFFDQLVSRTIMYVPGPIVGFFAKRYIAGQHLEDAFNEARKLNDQGIMGTIDVLGEFISTKDEALRFKEQAVEILEAIQQNGLEANISIKPTQMGMKLDREFGYANIREILERARELGNSVRIDMEDISCTDDTLSYYTRLRQEYSGHVGTVLQSYLRRTLKDIRDMSGGPLNIRLCKGIYNEPRTHAYKHPDVVNKNYVRSLKELFDAGAYVGIATHDSRLVYDACRLIEDYGLSSEDYEFQTLLGVDEELRRILVSQGHRLRVYIPFGVSWLPYAKRRLKENPDIARQALKQMVRLRGNA